MATNDLLAIATGGSANVLTQAEYAALASLIANGFPSGVVDSQMFNKVLRQATLAAAMLGKFTADASGSNVADDGSPSNFQAQFLAALRSANVFTTPAQFTNDTKAATTAFVQRALGNLQGVNVTGGTISVPVGDAGKLIVLGTTGSVFTLPALSSVPVGSVYHFWNGTSTGAGTVQRAGADPLFMASNDVGSVSVPGGESLMLVAGPNGWYAVGGSAMLKAASGVFGASLTASGYQKLPSGIIVQWGNATTSAGADTTVTYPLAFPTGAWSVTATPNKSGGTAGAFSTTDGTGATSFTLNSWTATGSRAAIPTSWLAIGR